MAGRSVGNHRDKGQSFRLGLLGADYCDNSAQRKSVINASKECRRAKNAFLFLSPTIFNSFVPPSRIFFPLRKQLPNQDIYPSKGKLFMFIFVRFDFALPRVRENNNHNRFAFEFKIRGKLITGECFLHCAIITYQKKKYYYYFVISIGSFHTNIRSHFPA